jgi:ATP-dependent exoDNAse (exonuclease V) alpha subunit
MKYILEGKTNLLIHGGAGTGKSTYIKELVTHIENFVVVAPTGTAALNLGEVVGASTIHSLFGFKLGLLGSDTSWAQKISSQRREKLALIETLVIDEISMVNADIMDAIDLSLQVSKKNKRPFGGVRLIMVGDLFQLPPVLNHNDKDLMEYVKLTYGSYWFFKAKVWNACDFETLILQETFRQTDREFIDVLNRLRRGIPRTEDIDWLNKRLITDQKIAEQSIRIVGTNREAAEVNASKLHDIDEEPKHFVGNWEEVTALSEEEIARFKKETPVDEKLALKIGAQVMFVKNDDQNTDGHKRRWVNGSMGIVTGFSSYGVFVRIGKEAPIIVGRSKWEFVKHEIEEEFVEQTGRTRQVLRPVTCLTYEQLPLDLGWAITTHKSQGKTYESAVISIGPMSKYPGHSYVALSRVSKPEGLHLTKRVSKTDFPSDDEVAGFLTGQPRILSSELGRQG